MINWSLFSAPKFKWVQHLRHHFLKHQWMSRSKVRFNCHTFNEYNYEKLQECLKHSHLNGISRIKLKELSLDNEWHLRHNENLIIWKILYLKSTNKGMRNHIQFRNNVVIHFAKTVLEIAIHLEMRINANHDAEQIKRWRVPSLLLRKLFEKISVEKLIWYLKFLNSRLLKLEIIVQLLLRHF